MRVTHHAFIGASVAIPLSVWSIPGAVTFLFSSIVIDLDHFLFYWFQERKVLFHPGKFLSAYRKWSYYGPRIHIFHNYEFVVLLGACAWIYAGMSLYLFAGILMHLICDQLESYHRFRYMRVRTLIGDVLRYKGYLRVRHKGGEKEYMINRRDTWWNHLRIGLSREQFKKTERQCGIFDIYPESPINKADDTGSWKWLV